MNKIVKEHYPASRLPEDLREGLDPGVAVTVTIEAEPAPHKTLTLEELFAARRPPYRTAEDIDQSIRKSRDEWDD